MKIIKYKLCTRVNHGTQETPEWVDILNDKKIYCTADNLESNEAIAKAEAHNGEYTIEDDGQPEPSDVPTQLDRVEAQATYTAIMTDTLLEV